MFAHALVKLCFFIKNTVLYRLPAILNKPYIQSRFPILFNRFVSWKSYLQPLSKEEILIQTWITWHGDKPDKNNFWWLKSKSFQC